VIGRFTGVDPIAEQFAFVSGFNYAENRVPNAIDLWGLQAFLVHGTSSEPSRWNNAKTINALQVISGNHTVNSEFDWSDLSGPFNNESSRQKAAARLSEYVMSNLQNDEDVTLIGHSHGGNVAIQAVNNIREALDAAGDNRNINLITIATPAYNGDEDVENPSNTKSFKHTHIYNDIDGVQTGLSKVANFGKTARRSYSNDKTNNVNLDVSSKYSRREGSMYGTVTRYDRIGAHSFDVEHPELINKAIKNGKIKKH
jgi:pimeloyl-ACP methyl ester carboxylesterase